MRDEKDLLGIPPFKGYGWLRRLRDWSLALLLIVGVTFGLTSPATADPSEDFCAPIEKWAGTLENLQNLGLEPFAFLQADDALIVTLVNPNTGQWSLFSMHRSGKDEPLMRYCLRAIGETKADPSYGAGEFPEMLKKLIQGKSL